MLFRLKTVFRLLVILGLTWVAAPAFAQGSPPPPAGPVTYQTFYDSLSPYGQWVTDPDYGYAWVPAVGPNFQPYRTNGHWVYTDYGWTWVSNYEWGWAAFHYGRWRYSDAYGWLWVPGYTWGPAWVAWRQSAGYYGWAPLGPPPPRIGRVHVSIGFSFSFGDAPVAPARWCFVPAAYVASPAIATYYVPPRQTAVVYNNTTIIHNTYVNKNVTNINNTTVVNNQNQTSINQGRPRRNPAPNQPNFPAGPARADVEKATGQPITPLAVSNRATPGVGVQGKNLAFYRPDVAAPAPAGPRNGGRIVGPAATPAPKKIVPLEQAARQGRQLPAANQGLMRDNAARHLSSTDANPVRIAKQRQAEAQAATPATSPPANKPELNQNSPTANRINAPNRPGRPIDAPNANPTGNQLAKVRRPDRSQVVIDQTSPNDNTLTNSTNHALTPAQPDQVKKQRNQDQQQARQQVQAAHQEQKQDQQQKQQAKEARQQAQQARQQQQAKQAQQQQQQARQHEKQARQQRPKQARLPHPEDKGQHR